MAKYDALFEDEDDIFGGTPVSKYWDIANQTNNEVLEDEFDMIVERIAAMESMLNETNNEEDLDQVIKSYVFANADKIDALKKSVYMELAGKLIFRSGD